MSAGTGGESRTDGRPLPAGARWLTAAELRDGVRLATGREHVLVVPSPQLVVEGPAEHTLLITHPAAAGPDGIAYAPRMPDFAFRVRVTGLQQDPTPTTTFTWTARLDYDTLARAPRHSRVEWTATAAGGAAPLDLFRRRPGRILEGGSGKHPGETAVAGGTLTVTVAATVGGQPLRGTRTGYQVLFGGAHPPSSAFRAYLAAHVSPADAEWLSRILCVETRLTHFWVNPPATGRFVRRGHPVFNVNPGDGGAGVAQVTNRPGQAVVAGPAEFWDWRANLDGGIAIYVNNGRRVAAWVRAVTNAVGPSVDGSHAPLVQNVNAARRAAGLPPLARVVVPQLTPEQFRDDQARAYNGWIGLTGQFGQGWHEFRLATDGGGAEGLERLRVTNERAEGTARVADAVWARIRPEERPRKPPTPTLPRGAPYGNPHYVDDVRGAACP